ncbi:chemotaxis protein CheA [Acetobacter sp.]|jgi:two-component system chemotaxis sensor kinase CheA|uniref:chemotaxis protein CheA n=1 Tax=Acetobacter sp. TaxID=440 RepID=UPI0025BC26DF|nr:chemotaxis protein CheA [Acetobacter sp.]MCH4091025.1 chemotaxis protein CheA [Acetobacter sp.]MCI1300208.1 chemotaxis protein CheA [Acetobacter sp.]MCI1316124.1 chemotaxis protein CheA [Acetobacter sp.]
MDELDAIKPIFFEECSEQLVELERALAILESGEADQETVNSAFRAVHSIKGGAGSFGMTELVRFAHVFETALDLLRSHKIESTHEVLKIFLRATDILSDLTAFEQGGEPVDEQRQQESIQSLEALLRKPDEITSKEEEEEEDWGLPEGFVPVPVSAEIFSEPAVDQVAVDTPDDSTDGFEIFDFEPIKQVKEEEKKTEEKPFKNIESKKSAQGGRAAPSSSNAQSIRVDVSRIDRLMDLVGELVIGQAALRESFSSSEKKNYYPDPGGSDLSDAMNSTEQLTRDLQDAIMAVRAQPMRAVFQRMQRVVREAAHLAGKQVHLEMEGEDTEVDRTLIEKLTDPLTHMLRNAVDHGVEKEQVRLQHGKPEAGTIRLSAAHKSGRIVITLSDDGAGINRVRVRDIAVEKGIVSADAQLSDADIDNLIFAPGFSTATTVTDLSGRGVGMDVVKQAIQDLGGRISITSEAGKGSSFSLSLPLTLAVMDGMLVTVAGQLLILPVSCIVETMQVSKENIFVSGSNSTVICVRGRFIPIVDVSKSLGIKSRRESSDQPVILIVEDDAGKMTALAVDRIEGQLQVVIKSIEKNYRSVRYVSAATILGSGRVALILDVPEIATSAEGRMLDMWISENENKASLECVGEI